MTGTVCDWAKAIFCFSVKPIGSSRQASPLCFIASLARQQYGLGRRSSEKTRSYSVIMGRMSELKAAIVRRGVERWFDGLDGLLAGRFERRFGLRVGRHLLPLRAQLGDHLLELGALVARLVLHAGLVLVEERVARFDADLVLGNCRRCGQSEANQYENTTPLHVIRSAC